MGTEDHFLDQEVLLWTTEDCRWIKEDCQWIIEDIRWIIGGLQWIREDLQWINGGLQWIREVLPWITLIFMTIHTTDSLEVKDKGIGTAVRVPPRETLGGIHLRATSEALQQTEAEGVGLVRQEKIHVVETEGIGKHSV